MALFDKGNKVGNRFTSGNQPHNRGRKPSLYKKLKSLTGMKVGYELEKEDYFNVIRWVMEQNTATLELMVKGADGKPNKDVPLWLINIISALNADVRYGRTSTVEMIFDRVFGKATQPIEGDISTNVTGNMNLSVLTTEELLQYNTLLEKIKRGGDGDGAK